MPSNLNSLMRPFKSSKAYWYLAPKGFWPGLDNPKGIPGFHRFLQILTEFQERERTWNQDHELEVLIVLEDEDIVPHWEDQEDFHAHFRNRVNFAKKLGFAVSGANRPLALTEVGTQFLKTPKEQWPEIFEHQLLKFQFTNPSMPSKYKDFRLFPYIFTISILLDVESNYISLPEFILRVMISKSNDEKDIVLNWLKQFRSLPETDKVNAKTIIDSTSLFAARTVTFLFDSTPSIKFEADLLTLKDRDRARYLLAKCLPHLNYIEYPSPESWADKFGQFDKAFWPLMPESAIVRRKKHQQYVKREEGSEHKAIKKYLIDNAEAIWGKGASLFEEEYSFESGDSANLVFSLPNNQFVTVEVEVDVGEDDIAGLLQAIKYKYMFPVQTKLNMDQVKGMLIARKIHPSVKALCQKYGIKFLEVNAGS